MRPPKNYTIEQLARQLENAKKLQKRGRTQNTRKAAKRKKAKQ